MHNISILNIYMYIYINLDSCSPNRGITAYRKSSR